MKILRIATRNSPLALWQAEHVKARLLAIHSDLQVDLVGMTTAGDRFLSAPLIQAGGKGLFIKELEQAMLDHKADIAVHSMKDVTIDMPEEFILPVIMQREDARDVFISNKYTCIEDLPDGGVLGTSSLRRQSQVSAVRPDLQIKNLRGNVGTRLSKLDSGEYDAIILAAAGVIRLGLQDRVAQYIPEDTILPAIGQGAVGIECRKGDVDIESLIAPLNNKETTYCVSAERAFSRRLYGGCQLPIAAKAMITNDQLTLAGLVARVDGSEILKDRISGDISNLDALGIELAERLLDRGAEEILQEVLKSKTQ